VLLDDTLAGEVDKGLLGAVRDSIVQVRGWRGDVFESIVVEWLLWLVLALQGGTDWLLGQCGTASCRCRDGAVLFLRV
jgi:hypothetical protein